MPTCRNVKGRIVCGSLSKGGVAGKTGVYLLHKGERVVGKAAMAKLKKQGKDVAKKQALAMGKKMGKQMMSKMGRKGAGGGHKKKCKCKR